MITFKNIIVLSSLAFFLSSCTSTPRPTWYKQGVTQSVTSDKLGYCKTEVGADKLSKNQAKKMIKFCMEADDYSYGVKPRN